MSEFEKLEMRVKHFMFGIMVGLLGAFVGVIEWINHTQGRNFLFWACGFIVCYLTFRFQQFWKFMEEAE